MSKLILVDGFSILFRAYYATAYPGANLMKTSQGVYTNALFAFVGMFEKIVEDKDAVVLVAFDSDEPTKRHLSYEGYKANRSKMPEELAAQIDMVKNYINIMGIHEYNKGGYEADDIIGTLAKLGAKEGYQVEIYSSDRDLLQLVNDHVTVRLLKKGMKEVIDYTPKSFYDSYELSPKQMIDLKALMGDPSDNIPGIPGVGEKTAINLLKQYESLDNIILHKDDIPGKLGEKVKENIDLALLSKELVTIDLNASIDFGIKDLTRTNVDNDKLQQFFLKYELFSFARKINVEPKEEGFDVNIIESHNELSKILDCDLAIYFEFSDSNYHNADLWGVGLSNGKKHYFVESDIVLSSLDFQMYLADNSRKKFVYDYKAMEVFLLWNKLDINGVSFDLLLASYLVNSNLGKESFKKIANYFDYDDVGYDDEIYGSGAKKSKPLISMYAKHVASKARAIYILKDKILKTLVEQDQLKLLVDLELPLSKVLAKMEFEGLIVDNDELELQEKDLNLRIKNLEEKIYKLANKTFNISSTKQLGEVLFEDLKLPHGKKTKTGYSTNVDVLNSLLNEHPIIKEIQEYRQLTKLYSTYIDGIRNVVFKDNKVHTIYMQALTTTGRLSSIEPNLQNIPIRTEEGRKIRKIFIPSKDNYFLGCDYSQIELRVLADIADVKLLKEAFSKDEDIHERTAKEVFHVDKPTSEQRRAAKAVNFGIIYGISSNGLSEDLNISYQEAQEYIDSYLSVYPEIKEYMTNITKFAYDHEYVETIFKRRRYIPELKSPVYHMRMFGERTALNAPVQGSAADIIKKAMIELDDYLVKNNKKSKLLLQVHDELILDVPKNELEEMKSVVPRIMSDAVKMSVDLKTSCDVGKTWYELK